MAIVLGPELDLFLREIGEDLRGKTILEEPYVDRKTILRALKEQNKVILALQQHILEMKDVEERMQEKLERMEEKVISLEKYSSKVDKNVNDHVGAIMQISTKLKENEQSLAAFETETKCTRDSLSKLQKDLDNMPETICISSRQVTHSIIDEKMIDENCSEMPGEENTKKFLIDIIAEREQHVLLQEKQLKGLEIMIDDMKLTQNKSIDEIKRSIGDLTDWKHAQSGVDLETIKMDLDSINAKNEDFQKMLHRKMSKEDVEIKLNRQFDDIVEHLQSALMTIENEEADFKGITDSLSKMCESLREKKADKAELVSLRKQFIENQLEGYGAKGGSTLDNESLRRQLSNYPTKDIVLKMIQHHYDTVAFSDIIKNHSQMKHFQTLVKHSIASQSDESDTNPDYIYNMSQLGVNDNDTSITEKNYFKNSPLTKVQEPVSGNTLIEQGGRIPNDMDLNDNEQRLNRFPSSSVVTGVLSKVQNNCDKERNHNQEQNNAAFRNLPSRRPFTAPPKKTITELNNNKLAKKHSLPAILTSISKMRPRSKMKSNQRSHVSFIHKGSYQVINSGIGKSSDHFMSEPLSFRKNDRPNTSGSSSSEQYSKKKQGYRIRTSIE